MTTNNELVDIVEVIEVLQRHEYLTAKLRSGKFINHFRTQTTREAIEVMEALQGKLTFIANMLKNRIDKGNNLSQLKAEFQEQVRQTITAAVWKVYLLGISFIDKFAQETLGIDEDDVKKVTKIIDGYEQRFWGIVSDNLMEIVKEKLTPSSSSSSDDSKTIVKIHPQLIKQKIQDATGFTNISSAFFDIGSLFAFLSNDLTFGTLADSTSAAILKYNVVNEEQVELYWISERDMKVCPICAFLDGQQRPVNGLYDGPDGKQYRMPPDPHNNCRCRLLPFTEKLVFTG